MAEGPRTPVERKAEALEHFIRLFLWERVSVLLGECLQIVAMANLSCDSLLSSTIHINYLNELDERKP